MTQKDWVESRNLNNATVTHVTERFEKKGFVKELMMKKIKERRMFCLHLKENKLLIIS